MPSDAAFMEKLVALCRRRGFIFQSSEIYGGIGGFWDYGPLGVELKRNIKNAWWHDYVTNPPNGPDGEEVAMVGLDCSIIMNPKVWEASGHATGFADPMVDCKACKARMRPDQIVQIGVYETNRIELTESVVRDHWNAGPKHVAASATNSYQECIERILKKEYRARMTTIDDAVAFGGARGRIARTDKGDFLVAWHRLDDFQGKWSSVCPECGQQNSLTEPRQFNLMFKTFVGALEDASNQAWLRPETAQGIFANYKNVLDTSRVKLPFGVAQVGKAFRNEINPRNFTFRSREFEQMEIEFFCRDEESLEWYKFWRNHRFNWYVKLGLKSEKLRLRDQGPEELAHYSKACADIEYLFPFSDEHQELEGCAHRGCFDLTQHQTHSGKDLTYFDDDAWQRDAAKFPEKDAATKAKSGMPYRFLPTVIEPSAGADRATLAFLCEAYTEDQKADTKGVMQTRVYMRFHPRLAPIKAAFFPLVNKEGMPEIAEGIYRDAKRHMNVFYDDGGSIGRRYARMDEAGTPYCITIDGDTVKDGSVTVRHRDTLEQIRVDKSQIVAWLREKVASFE